VKHRPTKSDLLAAVDRTIPDVIAPGLTVLFCGTNPGLYSAAIGRHYGRPGNRFWPTLHAAGFTLRLFDPSEERELLGLGYGITDVVRRSSAAAGELARAEIVAGGKQLRGKVEKYAPRFLAVLGIGIYRVAFGKPKAEIGLQLERIGDTRVWVLPNPSGLNAHYQPAALVRMFAELHAASRAEAGSSSSR